MVFAFLLQYTKESIQQLVLDAENLVRDEILFKTPTRNRRKSAADMSNSTAARQIITPLTSSKIKRVEHWLHNQSQSKHATPSSPIQAMNTDGEASCEYTESDSAAQNSEEDGSEEFADSVATCLPGVGNRSQCTSTEVLEKGSGDLLKESPESSSQSTKLTFRTKRRNSERPVSVSCISQLTKQSFPAACSSDDANTQGLANHSISESALHTLNVSSTGSQCNLRIKGSDSKNSLKRRRMRLKKKQRSESGSNASEGSGGCNRRNSYNCLTKSESFTNNLVIQETQPVDISVDALPPLEKDNEENIALPKPNFNIGAIFNPKHLGTLAPLAFYNMDGGERVHESFTGTEENSNLSEQQVWDDYQEKYMSEAYSEGRDSDAARKLLEFGDDYRNFLDSQSDCCSSLSAANNLDSLSPPRGRKFFGSPQIGNKSASKSPSDEDNTLQRRRAHELELERRRRNHSDCNRKTSTEGMISFGI